MRNKRYKYCKKCLKVVEWNRDYNLCTECFDGDTVAAEAFKVGVWPPPSYIAALKQQGIDTDKMISERGGLIDFNVTGDHETVITSLKHYREILRGKGLAGEIDTPDHARDLERDRRRGASVLVTVNI